MPLVNQDRKADEIARKQSRLRWWPRSIRWQLLAGLVMLEGLSIVLFALILVRQQTEESSVRARSRLAYEAQSLAAQSAEAIVEQRPGWVGLSVEMMGNSPTVAMAKVTDPQGNMLFISKGDELESPLDSTERAEIPQIRQEQANCITLSGGRWECVSPIYTATILRGYAWVEFDKRWMVEQTDSILRSTAIFGVIWVAASALLVFLLGRSITRPLAILHGGAASLMSPKDGESKFPLPKHVDNEFGDVIETFNRMVASLEEQRAGLNDTLSLLDSMLANAPIGLAFVDRGGRFVRVNKIFADLTGVAASRHLGRTLPELVPESTARDLEAAVERVLETEAPVRNLELNGESGTPKRPWSWLISAYPVRTTPNQIRWVGIIALDASERKRNEEALRRSEKLAVTGRLAASIAHEINNPLEAITNLLFLLRNSGDLPEAAQQYVDMAEHEVQRVTEITQQTLRFYRQPTLPGRATMEELLDSVLTLYQSRLSTLDIHVEPDYDATLSLFCFAGEIRQIFANLVGNAIDASSTGGRLVVRARPSRDWKNPSQTGVRFVVGDTGSGMEPQVREHIFEAFFTTKEVTGTGLGLWVSYEIVMKHHGSIRVRSRTSSVNANGNLQSCGTVFELFLPDDPNLAAITSSQTR